MSLRTRNVGRGAGFLVIVMVSIALGASGCQQRGIGETKDANSASTLPRLSFHKPKTLVDAVARLRAIHDAFIGEQALPAPLSFRVREAIHGSGAGAHSHFYLDATGKKHVENDGHADMEESERFHHIEVDIVTEATDLIGWLPKIAAATDGVEEWTWNSVNQVAMEMDDLMNTVCLEQRSVQSLQESYRSNAESFDALIKKLEQLVELGQAEGGA